MEIIEILKTYNEDKIIKLIKKNKLNINLEELLIQSTNLGNNKLSNYLINKGVSFEYKDNLDDDCYLIAVMRGNINIIKNLMSKGLNLYKKYTIYNHETYAISEIRDLNTFKFFEENELPKKVFNKCIEDIVCNTVSTHNIELLSYLIENYKINITKFVYKTPNKNYSILDRTEELINKMQDNEKRKREMVFFIEEVFNNKKYAKEIQRAYQYLNALEQENKELNKYYKFIKEKWENKNTSIN